MKSTFSISLLLFVVSFAFAQQLPERNQVLQLMTLANDYFMKKWPDTGKTIITNRERPSNIWTRGIYYEGLMALHQIYPKKEYYNYAVAWAEFHNWECRFLQNWGFCTSTRATSKRCTKCTCLRETTTATMACLTKRMVCGGETRISTHPTKSLMVKIATGVVEMVGLWRHW